MRRSSFASVVTIVTFLTAAIAVPATAGPAAPDGVTTGAAAATPTAASPLRVSIDRAARAATQPVAPVRGTTPVRKAMMQGGGGGGGMMLMTLIGTAVGLAGTYFIVKEMRKQSDEARNAQ